MIVIQCIGSYYHEKTLTLKSPNMSTPSYGRGRCNDYFKLYEDNTSIVAKRLGIT